MAINDLLSEELKIQPLKAGETKLFRRMLVGKLDGQTGEPYQLSDFWQSGKTMILDPFSKKKVLLLNEVGQRPVSMPDGTTRMEPIVEMVKWGEGGDMLVTEFDFEQMCYLIRSDNNASNVWRNKRRRPQYYEVDPAKESKAELADFDLTTDAAMYCRNAKMDELKAIAKNLNIKAADDGLRMAILNKVKAGYARDIMIASTNTTVKKRIQVTDAEKYGMIIYNDISGEWYFSNNTDKPICEISLDKDRVDGLLEFFGTKEGKGRYAQLASKVKKLYDAVD